MKIAIDDEHVIQAIAVLEHAADVGAYAICPAAMDPMLVPGPYKIPRYGFSMSMVWTNTMGKAAYRGPWMFETTLREMAIDHAAHELGIDPVELRRRNLLSMGDLPFTSPGNNTFQEITPLETLEQALEMLDYEAFRAEQAAARAEGRYLGLGVSVYVEPTSMGSSTLYTEAATVRVESSGKVVAFLGTTSHGQSIETTMAQIVADHLGVGYDDVTIVQADTQSTPYGPGTGGSRTAVVAGGAIRASSLAVRAKVLEIAAHAMEASPDDLEIENSTVSVRGTPSRSISMKDVAKLAYRDAGSLPPEIGAGLEATMRFRPTQFPTWSNATHLCVVEIDAPVVDPAHPPLHRVGGLRADDQPDGGRGPDLRRRGPGHRRGAPRGLRLRRRRQPAHHHLHGLPAAHHERGARDRGRPHRDGFDHQPRWVQGHG